jgi:hypothetical protein
MSRTKTNPVDAAARVAETVDLETMFGVASPLSSSSSLYSSASALSAQDLAAARKLGPLARALAAEAVETVSQTFTRQEDGTYGEPRLIPEFGAVCHLATQQALQRLHDEYSAGGTSTSGASGDSSAPYWKARIAQQIRRTMLETLDAEFVQMLDIQLDLLSQQCFDEFRKNLSKLLIGPNLGRDMREVAKQALASFTKTARKVVSRKQQHCTSKWTYQPALKRLEIKVMDFITSRLEIAEANGQYRPLPRKGITVGLHWLLPKPFGNDFRQEPWMVHAADSLTYVPPNKKLSDVNPKDVLAGDWRDKIVPSPAGNDMVYMQ